MKNPFLSVSDIDQTEYLTPRVSLNRAVIAKLPLRGVEDEIEGKPFKDIFSTPLIVRDIRATLKRYGLSTEGIPDSELPKLVDEGLRSENARKRQMAEQIARRFGRRLGLLLLMLRTGERENRLARDDWDDACWEFWKQLDAVNLHRHIVRTIVSSFKEASQNTQLSGTVLISVANYVRNGVLNPERGGFSKLSLLGGNYASLLSEELSSELHREISVRLVHDSTASAVYFDDEDNAVCITLGTAFGVGFPDTKL